MLQFFKAIDKTTAAFTFLGCKPNVGCGDYMGDGLGRRNIQVSIDRGMFYVWADKVGTQRDRQGKPCVAGNYFPSWIPGVAKYAVQGRWADKLWKAHKLPHDVYEEYIYLIRDGVVSRKRNLDAVRTQEVEVREASLIVATTNRIRANPALYHTFPQIPAAVEWLALFSGDAMRYPMMIVLGASFSGKTQWANSLFKHPLELTIGTLAQFPEGMRSFNREHHDGLVLDDIRDLEFLASHQDKLQASSHRAIEFAHTPGGTCAYKKYLYKVPVVATVNYSTVNLHYLSTHDWLKQSSNRVVVEWPAAMSTARGSGAA